MSEKIYTGSGKQMKYGVKIALCLSDIPKEHIFEHNGKKYIKLNVMPRKEPDQYGKTHYITVDTFKPEQQEANDNLPF